MLVLCVIALLAFECIMLAYNDWYWCAIAYLRINEPRQYKTYKEALKTGVKIYLHKRDYTEDRLNGKLPKYFLFPYYCEGGIHFCLYESEPLEYGGKVLITDFWPLTEKLQKNNKWNNQL